MYFTCAWAHAEFGFRSGGRQRQWTCTPRQKLGYARGWAMQMSEGIAAEQQKRKEAQPQQKAHAVLTLVNNGSGDGSSRHQLRGRRVYITDLDMEERDVFENEGVWGKEPDKLRSDSSAGTIPRWEQVVGPVLLPRGYPATVSPDYVSFVSWNMLRHVTSSAYGVLGTQTMLLALGFGKSAIALSAAWNWVLKDGLGMGVKVLITSRLASLVDLDPKRWRLLGDSVMTVGTALEIATAFVPQYFFWLASFGNAFKKGADAATGPSYRVFLNSFAVDSNIGDVSARAEAQVVIGNLIGLGSGVGLSALLGNNDPEKSLFCYVVLAAMHVGCTWKSLKGLQLRTLNWKRLHCVITTYLESRQVPSVAKVNEDEKILQFSNCCPDVVVGCDFLDYIESGREAMRLLSLHQRQDYMVGFNHNRAGVMLSVDASATDIIAGILQARHFLKFWEASSDRQAVWDQLVRSHQFVEGQFSDFLHQLHAEGWETERVLINTKGSRYKSGDYED